jgi:preprotein translocase subunit YajC
VHLLIDAATKTTKTSSSGSFVFLLLIVLVIGFMFLRPGRRKQRQQVEQMRTQILPGAEVRTTAGLYATVKAVSDDYVTLEVAPGVLSRYDPRAVVAVTKPVDAEPGGGLAGDASAAAGETPEPEQPEKPEEPAEEPAAE